MTLEDSETTEVATVGCPGSLFRSFSPFGETRTSQKTEADIDRPERLSAGNLTLHLTGGRSGLTLADGRSLDPQSRLYPF
jgi:hypothetical protein